MLTRPLTQPLTGPLVRGAGEGGVLSFNPANLSGLQAWYDAIDPTGYMAIGMLPQGVFRSAMSISTVYDRKAWPSDRASALQPERITNGAFASSTGWSLGSGWTISGGTAQRTTAAGSSNLQQSAVFTIGKTYYVTLDITAFSTSDGGALKVFCGNAGQLQTTLGVGSYTFTMKCAGDANLYIQATTAGTACTIDNVSFREVPGNHATQLTTSLCPLNRPGGWFDFDGVDDKLTAAFPSSLGAACTVAYVNASGVTYLAGQTVGTSYDLPTADWSVCMVFDRALTAIEQTRLTNYLLARRDAAYNNTIAGWGDSWAAGSGASADKSWPILLQTKFTPRRDEYNGGVGGNTAAQTATLVAADTTFPAAVMVFIDKINTGEATSDWQTSVAAILAHNTSGRFLALSAPTGTGEGTGTDAYNNTATINAWLAATYPNNYLDIRRYLIDHGLTDAGISATANDLADIAADTIPRSLLNADGIHPNDAGHAIIATQVYNFIRAKGW